jgi:hypothetical protein
MLKAPMEICAVGFHGYVEVMSNKEKYFYNMTNPYRCNTKKMERWKIIGTLDL